MTARCSTSGEARLPPNSKHEAALENWTAYLLMAPSSAARLIKVTQLLRYY